MEGGRRIIESVKAVTSAGILVFGHIGLTPQTLASLGGFRVQGKTAEKAKELLEDALGGLYALHKLTCSTPRCRMCCYCTRRNSI